MRAIRSARVSRLSVAFVAALAAVACGQTANKTDPSAQQRLVATYRTEPGTFNRLVSPQATEELIARLTHATLVRLNRTTRVIEPRLARSWTTSPDGLVWTLTLIDGARFSDGVALTSADVVFTFRAVYDARVNSPMAAGLKVDGQPLTVRALDARTVVLTFPAAHGPGLAMLDSLPILPAHKLQGVLDAGTFGDAWTLATPPADIVGLGPFALHEYVRGQRLVFRRNPHFWVRDAAGAPLPYLDEIELQIVPDQNAELVRFQSGAADLMTDQVRPEDIASLRPLERDGRIRLHQPGVVVNPNLLWFNLSPSAPARKDRPWLQREELRRAISHAVDRRAFVDTVYLGAAEPIFGPLTPGHGDWLPRDLPRTDFDPARAAALLAGIGLRDRNGDGMLDDERGRTARWTLITQAGNAIRERSAAVIQEALRKVGLQVDVTPIDGRMVGAAVGRGDYDAVFFGFNFDSFDPGRAQEFWLSSGAFHVWHAGQSSPATRWEAEIDELIRQQSRTTDLAERQRLFHAAQHIFAEHLPAIFFAAPTVTVATSARVQGATPSVLPPPVLWNAEQLSVRAPQ